MNAASAGPTAAAPIGIFDSGVGGLTVARAIMDQLPHEPLIYVGDTEHAQRLGGHKGQFYGGRFATRSIRLRWDSIRRVTGSCSWVAFTEAGQRSSPT